MTGKVPRGLDAIPCLRSIFNPPAEITAGKGLGLRQLALSQCRTFHILTYALTPYVKVSAPIYLLIEELILET